MNARLFRAQTGGLAKWRPFAYSATSQSANVGARSTAATASRRTRFASVWTGSTTVRLAARRATFELPAPMTIEHALTELTLHNDPRLIAAVEAVVSHAARRAGLSEGAERNLSAAAVDSCCEAFQLVSNHSGRESALRVAVADFADRVEVSIEYWGRALSAASLGSISGGAPSRAVESLGDTQKSTAVDSAQCETREGLSRVTLIKYCGVGKPRPEG